MARSKSRSDASTADALDLRGVVEPALGDLDCLVLIDLDISHQPPQLSLVNGALAEVHYVRRRRRPGAAAPGLSSSWRDAPPAKDETGLSLCRDGAESLGTPTPSSA